MPIEEKGISYKAWIHPSPRAVFMLVHGLGANSTWWEFLGSFLLKNGISSYAIDLRKYSSFKEFKHNCLGLHNLVKKYSGDKKVFALGESMGALIVLSMALENKTLFSGLVCISPVFKSRAALTLIDYFKIFFPLLYNPKSRHKLPFSADMCTRDRSYINVIKSDYDKDVLSTSRVLFDILIAQIYMRLVRMDPGIPVLFLLGGDDKLTDGKISKKVFGRLKSSDKTIIEYPGMYHSISIEIEKEKVFQDILKWSGERI